MNFLYVFAQIFRANISFDMLPVFRCIAQCGGRLVINKIDQGNYLELVVCSTLLPLRALKMF